MRTILQGQDASKPGRAARDEVVEVPLLLPPGRMQGLITLSRRRGESIGQILRRLIDEALAAEGI